jgi:Flp pilus assembly protein TadD
MQNNTMINRLCGVFFMLILALATPIIAHAENSQASLAVEKLLLDAKSQYDNKQYEKAAALLERALRIAPNNPVLWHNLGGVRLQQEDWERAASLAAKSNSFSPQDRSLRVRNWILISLACKGMNDTACMNEAQKRALSLAH